MLVLYERVDPRSDPSSDPSSDPGSDPSSDPGSDPDFILSLSRCPLNLSILLCRKSEKNKTKQNKTESNHDSEKNDWYLTSRFQMIENISHAPRAVIKLELNKS